MRMNLSGKWVISFDDDNWSAASEFESFDSKEELIAFIDTSGEKQFYDFYLDEKGEEPSEAKEIGYYIGQVEAYVPHICAGTVIDNIGEQAYDETCGYTDDYLNNVTDEQERDLEDELNTVLAKWLEKHNLQPTFFNVVNIEKIYKEVE